MKNICTYLLLTVLLSACGPREGKTDGGHALPQGGKEQRSAYAQFFSIRDYGDYQILTVLNPWKSGQVQGQYLLYTDSSKIEQLDTKGFILVKTPLQSLVPLSTSFYGYLDAIGETPSVTGIENHRYVFSEDIRKRVQEGSVSEVGQSGTISVESVLMLQPSAVMISGSELPGPGLDKISQAGIPVIQNMDWQEQHPLGRAEWIRVFGALYGKKSEADSIFTAITDQYITLAAKARSAVQKNGKVLLGYNYQGTWFLPGGKSYVAAFLRDAGALYPYAGNNSTGSLHISYEKVFAEQQDAEFWLHPGACRTLEELRRLDPRYSHIAAFRTGKVYNYTRRITAEGGNDFWESGPCRPHSVLADLIAIFHPELLPGHQLYYYEQLK